MAKERIITYIGAVLTNECDSNHHMNVMYYINKFELANRNFMGSLGVNQYMKNKDLGVAVVEQNIKYKKEVFEDDLLFIESELISVADKTIKTKHYLFEKLSGRLSAEIEIVTLIFDMKRRKAVSIPNELRSEITKLL